MPKIQNMLITPILIPIPQVWTPHFGKISQYKLLHEGHCIFLPGVQFYAKFSHRVSEIDYLQGYEIKQEMGQGMASLGRVLSSFFEDVFVDVADPPDL